MEKDKVFTAAFILMQHNLENGSSWADAVPKNVVISASVCPFIQKPKELPQRELTEDEQAALYPEEMEPLPRPISLAAWRRVKFFAGGKGPF